MKPFEEIAHISMKISQAFEDLYGDPRKREIFQALFSRYLEVVDPNGEMEPYDAIILLGRKHPHDFDRMVAEMRHHSLLQE